MLDSFGQAKPEDLQEASNLVRQIDCLVEQGFATTQQRACAMCLSALHVDRAEPASSQDMSNAAGVVLIGLVPHRRQGGANLASFHADDIKAIIRKPIEQMLAHGASLKPDPRNRVSEALQTLGDFTDITGQFALKGNATPRIHNAQRARSQRHIQSGKILHRLSPLFTDILCSYRELDLRSGSAQLRMLRAQTGHLTDSVGHRADSDGSKVNYADFAVVRALNAIARHPRAF